MTASVQGSEQVLELALETLDEAQLNQRIAAAVEQTLLKQEARPIEIETLCEQAEELSFHGVCVAPLYVPLSRSKLRQCKLVTVVGFPLGQSPAPLLADECRWVIEHGADEVDMVIPIGFALAGDEQMVHTQISAAKKACGKIPLKVIFECGAFDQATDKLESAVRIATEIGVDFLKTSTGFGSRGALLKDLELFQRIAGKEVKITASVGIRSRQDAIALLNAGATRLGTSAGPALLNGAVPKESY